MLAFIAGLRRSQGFEPPKILCAWIVARFRDRILHEGSVKAHLPWRDLLSTTAPALLAGAPQVPFQLLRTVERGPTGEAARALPEEVRALS